MLLQVYRSDKMKLEPCIDKRDSRDYDISDKNVASWIRCSCRRVTRDTLDFPINQSRRLLKRYNVVSSWSICERRIRGGAGLGERARERRTKSHSAAFIVRALTSSLRGYANIANTRRAWRDDWQTLALERRGDVSVWHGATVGDVHERETHRKLDTV